jgi:hypothetical protein
VIFPAEFPMENYNSKTNKYDTYYTFNKLMYLNNFIYTLIEKNKSLNESLKESKPSKIGYNILVKKNIDRVFYNIYFVIKIKEYPAKSKIFMNIEYSKKTVDIYFDKIVNFLKKNYDNMYNHKLLNDIYTFYNKRKLNYNNKYIIVDGYYLPKCNIDLYENPSNNLLESILFNEIQYPEKDINNTYINVFKKLRNLDQLKKDLETANIDKNDFNDMIRNIKPLGFETKNQYREMVEDLAIIIKKTFKKFIIQIVGSSSTFYSANPHPEKANKFFLKEKSDIDIGIIVNENFDKYLPILEKDILPINNAKGIYGNMATRNLLGYNAIDNFFEKWGEQDTRNVPEVDISKTILKCRIGLVIYQKENLYDYLDVIKQNKTCLTNFSTFVNDNELSFWNENKIFIKKLKQN